MPFTFPVDFGRRDYCKNANNLGQVSVPVQITIACKGEVPRLKKPVHGKEIALSAAVPAGNYPGAQHRSGPARRPHHRCRRQWNPARSAS